MKEYVITEDRGRLVLYTVLGLAATVFLMLLTLFLSMIRLYLPIFITVPALWYSIKIMCRFGSKLIRKTPVCEFKKDKLIIYSLPGQPIEMKYKEVKEAKLLRGSASVKLFFGGEKVTHPSGYYYVGAVYPFQKKLLDEVEHKAVQCLAAHGIKVQIVEKQK